MQRISWFLYLKSKGVFLTDHQFINVFIYLFITCVHLNLVKGLLPVVLIEDNDMLFGEIVFNDDTIIFTSKNCKCFNDYLCCWQKQKTP